MGRFMAGKRPRTGAPVGRSCEYRVSSPQNTRTRGRRNNALSAGHHPAIPRGRIHRRCRRAGAGAGSARARAAAPCGGGPGAVRSAHRRGAVERRRRRQAHSVRAGPRRWLAGLARRSTAKPGQRPGELQLSDAAAGHVRELRAGVVERTSDPRRRAGGRNRGGSPAAGSRPAADLPGCVRLSGVCPPGRAARPRSLYALRGRSSE
jgi:hypothetical protein